VSAREIPGVPLPPTIYEQFQQAEQHGRDAANGYTTPSRPQRTKRTTRTNEYLYLTVLLNTLDPVSDEPLFSLVTEQMTAHQGVKRFGKAGKHAIAKELEQLLTRRVLHGVPSTQLNPAQRKAALRYLMFLKEKRCGTIKGRGCADGRKQRLYKTKDETSSPTVKNEALFLTCLIDAIEDRHVLVCDIPGAFMQADIDEVVHVKMDGAILDVLIRIDPSYNRFVTSEHGKPVLYTQLDKALYGTLQAALLFWKKLSTFLVNKMGFVLNPYDSCVANKDIDGSQCTIAWYVDDLKISHKKESVIENIFAALESEFGKQGSLTVTRGRVHNYLGMEINYSTPKKVKFSMPHEFRSLIETITENWDDA
jgi:Reverse transcriptase (RNA-dependent DNA polymerase)